METEYNSEKNPERKYNSRKPGRLRKAVIGTAAGLALIVGGAYVFPRLYSMYELYRIVTSHKGSPQRTKPTDRLNKDDKDYTPGLLDFLSGLNPDKNYIIDPVKGFDLENNDDPRLLFFRPGSLNLLEDPGIRQAMGLPRNKLLPSEKRFSEKIKYGFGNKLIIPGEWKYDFDSMRFPISSASWIEYGFIGKDVDYVCFIYGAEEEELDIFWQYIDTTKRRLVPKNGAELALLGKVDFDKVSLEDITAAHYSKEPIIGDDDNNQMMPGTVIGIKTNKGNYSKMLIEDYASLPLGKGEGDNNVQKYNLRCKLGIYFVPWAKEELPPKTKRLSLNLSGNDAHDIDPMICRNKEEADLFWQYIDTTKRRLVPKNGAELALLGKVDFDKVTLEDITAAHYSQEAIIGDDDNNQMMPGTVIGIKTNIGNYAKMLIESHGPLGKVKEGNHSYNMQTYHLRCTLEITYKPN